MYASFFICLSVCRCVYLTICIYVCVLGFFIYLFVYLSVFFCKYVCLSDQKCVCSIKLKEIYEILRKKVFDFIMEQPFCHNLHKAFFCMGNVFFNCLLFLEAKEPLQNQPLSVAHSLTYRLTKNQNCPQSPLIGNWLQYNLFVCVSRCVRMVMCVFDNCVICLTDRFVCQ